MSAPDKFLAAQSHLVDVFINFKTVGHVPPPANTEDNFKILIEVLLNNALQDNAVSVCFIRNLIHMLMIETVGLYRLI